VNRLPEVLAALLILAWGAALGPREGGIPLAAFATGHLALAFSSLIPWTLREDGEPFPMSADRPGDERPRHDPFAALRKLRPDLDTGPAPEPQAAEEESEPRSAAPAEVHERVTVRRERSGRGGKTVTVAEGPGLAGRDLAPLAREAARALGVGGRVENGTIVLQGDQAARLAAWLATRGFTRVVRGN
jgi:translation initiation factor 1 (eIF-1/SUI1)